MNSPNPNDNTAAVYDLIHGEVKGPEVTLAERELILSLIPAGGKLLDVGCGTGRHLEVLADYGLSLTGIDSSSEMLQVLKAKQFFAQAERQAKLASREPSDQALTVVEGDIFTHDFGAERFDLIIMMWNAWNEMVFTEEQAEALLVKLKSLLTSSGEILINIDNPDLLDFAHFDFELERSIGGKRYHKTWKLVSFDAETRTTVSEETISVSTSPSMSTLSSAGGDEPVVYQSRIRQRWWSAEELHTLASQLDYHLSPKHLKITDELYLAFMV